MCTRRGAKKTSAGHSCDLVPWKRFLGVCLVSVKPAPLPWRRPPKAPPRRSACCRRRHFGTLDARPRPQVSELQLRPTAHTTENTRPVLTATESDPGSRENRRRCSRKPPVVTSWLHLPVGRPQLGQKPSTWWSPSPHTGAPQRKQGLIPHRTVFVQPVLADGSEGRSFTVCAEQGQVAPH